LIIHLIIKMKPISEELYKKIVETGKDKNTKNFFKYIRVSNKLKYSFP